MGDNLPAILGTGLVAMLFYTLSSAQLKNQGKLNLEEHPDEPEGVQGPDYAQTDIKGRNAEEVCSVTPPQMLSTSLLPAENQSLADDDFVTISPDKLANVNFLQSGWALGRDTTSNTMRNASYDLRSELPNPKLLNTQNNSWQNSTIEHMPRRSFVPDVPDEKLNDALSK